VTAAVAAAPSGVVTFNGRSGAVTLIANDISAAGGAPLASPAFIGTPTAPTATVGTNTTQLATCAYVMAALGTITTGVTSFNSRTGSVVLTTADVTTVLPSSATAPLVNGTAAPGTSAAWSRGDHVHPSDPTRLALSGGVMTGALTPSQTAGLVGTTAANNANAGAIGEYQIVNQTSGVALTTAVNANIATLSLSAGDWDVFANGFIQFSIAGNSAVIGISSVSASFPSGTYAGYAQNFLTSAGLYEWGAAAGMVRISTAATTTVYLVASVQFSSGTCSGFGTIQARRAR
jgi:hypothetical protein